MARLDRERLSQGVFPFRCEVATRFSDVDMQRHLNNVAVAEIFQEGRARFAYENDLSPLTRGGSLMVAALSIEYVGEMRHPLPVEVSVGVLEIGRTSYRVALVARQNGVIGAFAEVVMVSGKDGASTPITEEGRARLETLKIR